MSQLGKLFVWLIARTDDFAKTLLQVSFLLCAEKLIDLREENVEMTSTGWPRVKAQALRQDIVRECNYLRLLLHEVIHEAFKI